MRRRKGESDPKARGSAAAQGALGARIAGGARIALGISACLLGQEVRYDGGHKLDRYLRDTLGRFVTWVPVCPEAECGLGIPREAMHLAGTPAHPRLVTVKTGVDHTARMLAWIQKRLDRLAQEDLCGFVFKTRSPSSGMRGITVYKNGQPAGTTQGLFAGAFMRRFPLLPVEDEGRLNDPGLRESFIEKVFVFRRWKDYLAEGGTAAGLVRFHTMHKLLIMAHDPQAVSALGRIVAGAPRRERTAASRGLAAARDAYFTGLMAALSREATARKNVNVLQHIMGYFKKSLNAEEKVELLQVIREYHQAQVPLIVPVVLLRHYVRRFRDPYLTQQVYLEPHPVELALRNHV
jgi:uncharacterized protein YbgA (DUF1722 family)/uncharacterized protein YbbK (DUF523 family)